MEGGLRRRREVRKEPPTERERGKKEREEEGEEGELESRLVRETFVRNQVFAETHKPSRDNQLDSSTLLS